MARSIGKVRGLQQLADPHGVFTMVATDQRRSLAAMIDPGHPELVTRFRLMELKQELIAAFAQVASAVLVDPEFGLPAAITDGLLPGRCGLLVTCEESISPDRVASGIPAPAAVLEGWTVGKAKRLGASGVKLLVYYNPDDRETAQQQRHIVAEFVEECGRCDMPAVVEAVSYAVVNTADKPRVVVQSARDLAQAGVDLLKVEFPLDSHTSPDQEHAAQWCQRLNEACGGTPWVILSRGAPIDVFRRQVLLACEAGASGFLCGRALWQDAIRLQTAAQRKRHLMEHGLANFESVAEIARAHAKPWRPGHALVEQSSKDAWYQSYSSL